MKARMRPTPSIVIAMIALFISLGGSAVAVTRSGDTSTDRAGSRGKLTLSFGKLIDRDTTPFDGSLTSPPATRSARRANGSSLAESVR
jgi:hypothetical protein